jgi:two-component sensor histidine kinase
LAVEIEELILDLDQAIPVDLISSELVSNAPRHAFPNGRRAVFEFRLRKEGGARIHSAADDGAGLPGKDGEPLRPVWRYSRVLPRQLRGKIQIPSPPGTRRTIRSPEAPGAGSAPQP